MEFLNFFPVTSSFSVGVLILEQGTLGATPLYEGFVVTDLKDNIGFTYFVSQQIFNINHLKHTLAPLAIREGLDFIF